MLQKLQLKYSESFNFQKQTNEQEEMTHSMQEFLFPRIGLIKNTPGIFCTHKTKNIICSRFSYRLNSFWEYRELKFYFFLLARLDDPLNT